MIGSFFRWVYARAVMHLRRPDGGIVPSTAFRRFTSDAQVGVQLQTACEPWMGSRFLFPANPLAQGCQASS